MQKIDKVAVDEVLINGRRYRVPEKVIVLDFWNKLNKSEKKTEKCVHHLCYVSTTDERIRDSNMDSAMSSPLTSLSSLDDLDEHITPYPHPIHDAEDFKVAQVKF